jgi:hypothetical protein
MSLDSVLFEEVKLLFSTMPEVENFSESSWIEIEVTGSDRTWSQFDRTCPVSGSSCAWRGCGQFDRRVRSIAGPTRPVKHAVRQRGA